MKNIKNISDSKSLWNYTLSPGWTIEEVEVLKVALIKYGIGKWKRIKRSNCLSGKTIAQMNLQTQRLIGQQSLAEFMGLHVDLEKIFHDNKQKNGPSVIRKNNFIINTGDNLTLDQRKLRINQNKIKYELSPAYVKSLKIPRLLSNSIGHYLTLKQIRDEKNNLSITEKINELKNLIRCMKNKIRIIEGVESKRGENKSIGNIISKLGKDLTAKQAGFIILKKLKGKDGHLKYEIEESYPAEDEEDV